MGKMCCLEAEDDDGLDLKVILVVLVLALIFIGMFSAPPRRRAVLVYRCC
ncbi:hypothetical protein Acr_20g0007770 [Actinidia rufa]|uniref:Transmembrane protein n=1 Tax=Actinidia rufa TaxID=165716 RepID=A0A7J0GDW2_9ERIC|nr:hypothetical protein Acr_20g0007770 [Actinidia rufa]